MAPTRPLLRAGLTGGIASGKTTVARIFAALGAFVVDADELAHAVIEPGGSAYGPVVAEFGEELLDASGRIDRGRLARRVFGDDRAREALNGIVHPQVRAEFARRVEEYAAVGHAPVVIFDAALLVETGAWRDFHRLIVVRCSLATQLRRLLARNPLSPSEARARIEAQAPLERKLELAHYVIDTELTLRETRRQTTEVWRKLLEDFEQEFGRP